MSRTREHPPTEWFEGVQRIGESEVYVRLADTPADTIVWHWCTRWTRWEGCTIGLHTIVQREPLTITRSLHRPDCCGWHGWITDGCWIPA